jgi:hypothetical protein
MSARNSVLDMPRLLTIKWLDTSNSLKDSFTNTAFSQWIYAHAVWHETEKRNTTLLRPSRSSMNRALPSKISKTAVPFPLFWRFKKQRLSQNQRHPQSLLHTPGTAHHKATLPLPSTCLHHHHETSSSIYSPSSKRIVFASVEGCCSKSDYNCCSSYCMAYGVHAYESVTSQQGSPSAWLAVNNISLLRKVFLNEFVHSSYRWTPLFLPRLLSPMYTLCHSKVFCRPIVTEKIERIYVADCWDNSRGE